MSVKIPKYRLHRGTGQALVQINGDRIYLGVYDSPESHEQYRRIVAEYLATGKGPNTDLSTGGGLTIDGLIVAYFKFAMEYYQKAGKPTDEVAGIKTALRRLRKLYGRSAAADFGPKSFKLVRDAMIQENLSRKYINDSMSRIRRMFRWAVSEEHIDVSIYQALSTVPGLRRDRSQARETQPITSVSIDTVEATLVHMSPIVADMVRLQRLTGCRPQEICMMRAGDINQEPETWVYVPKRHKSQHKGRDRTIFLGPKAQKILSPYLLRPPESFCFSPAESEQQRTARRREQRQTPIRDVQKPSTSSRKRQPGDRYTKDSYRRAIQRACEKTEIDKWSPNQLRHTTATEIRRRFGVEAAQTVLGHSRADVTQVYAERDMSKAENIMREIG